MIGLLVVFLTLSALLLIWHNKYVILAIAWGIVVIISVLSLFSCNLRTSLLLRPFNKMVLSECLQEKLASNSVLEKLSTDAVKSLNAKSSPPAITIDGDRRTPAKTKGDSVVYCFYPSRDSGCINQLVIMTKANPIKEEPGNLYFKWTDNIYSIVTRKKFALYATSYPACKSIMFMGITCIALFALCLYMAGKIQAWGENKKTFILSVSIVFLALYSTGVTVETLRFMKTSASAGGSFRCHSSEYDGVYKEALSILKRTSTPGFPGSVSAEEMNFFRKYGIKSLFIIEPGEYIRLKIDDSQYIFITESKTPSAINPYMSFRELRKNMWMGSYPEIVKSRKLLNVMIVVNIFIIWSGFIALLIRCRKISRSVIY